MIVEKQCPDKRLTKRAESSTPCVLALLAGLHKRQQKSFKKRIARSFVWELKAV